MLAANVMTALATFAVLVLLLRRTALPMSPALFPWLVLVCSSLVFWLAQWENWVWGLQLQIFLAALTCVTTAWLLARWRGGWAGLGPIVLAAVAGALSFASGLLLFALLPAAVLVWPGPSPGRRRALQAAVVAVAGVMCVALYLAGMQHPSNRPLASVLSDPWSYGEYVVAYLGAGFSPRHTPVAAAWGAAGLVGLLAGAVYLWRRYPVNRLALAPWIFLALYAVLSGSLTGGGRIGFGVRQALAPRYVTIAVLFWQSLAVVLGLVLATAGKARMGFVPRPGIVVATALGIVLAAASYTHSARYAWQRMASRRDALHLATECAAHVDLAPDACLSVVHRNTARLRGWLDDMRRLGLGPFATPPEPVLATYTVVDGAAGVLEDTRFIGTSPTDDIQVAGWAVDPITDRPAERVLVAVDGAVLGHTVPGKMRRDVATAHGRWGNRSGWEVRFGRFRLAAGAQLVEAYAVVGDGRIVRLQGTKTVTVADERSAPAAPAVP